MAQEVRTISKNTWRNYSLLYSTVSNLNAIICTYVNWHRGCKGDLTIAKMSSLRWRVPEGCLFVCNFMLLSERLGKVSFSQILSPRILGIPTISFYLEIHFKSTFQNPCLISASFACRDQAFKASCGSSSPWRHRLRRKHINVVLAATKRVLLFRISCFFQKELGGFIFSNSPVLASLGYPLSVFIRKSTLNPLSRIPVWLVPHLRDVTRPSTHHVGLRHLVVSGCAVCTLKDQGLDANNLHTRVVILFDDANLWLLWF